MKTKNFKTLLNQVFFILITIIFSMLISCRADDSSSDLQDSNGLQEWKYKINGIQYQWKGDSNNVMSWGESIYNIKNGKVLIKLSSLQEPLMSFNIEIPELKTGTYIIENYKAYLIEYSTFLTWYCENNNQITVNITEIKNNKIKGTFSGKIIRETNQGTIFTRTISEGYFDAILEQ